MDFVLELAQLIKKTPRLALPTQGCENADYNAFLYKGKNCYLCFSSSFLEDCIYLDNSSESSNSTDCSYSNKCELCYECVDCSECYNSNFCQDCKHTSESSYCFECQSCTNCFGCVGLVRKNYCIFNTQYSKEDYFEKLTEIQKMPRNEIIEKVKELRCAFPHPCMHTSRSEDVYGDYIYGSKNCFMGFHVDNSQDCAYMYEEITNSKDCIDCTHIQNGELCYNLMSSDNSYNVDCSWWAVGSRDCSYSVFIMNCSDCLGCVNLQRKQYHILNKPYSKEDYFKKRSEIIEELKDKKFHGQFLLDTAFELSQTL